MVNEISIEIKGISKIFSSKRAVFRNVNYSFKSGNIYSITGQNGSGKSTLLKILAGVLSKSSGKIEWIVDSMKIDNEVINEFFGFVAPYLNLYEEFSIDEIVQIVADIRGIELDLQFINRMVTDFGLEKRTLDPISSFSSGMKQRVKFIIALLHKPKILLLDEPFTNFDELGKQIVTAIIMEIINQNGIVIIASNDKDEIEICNKNLSILDFQ
ncbi:MAG: ABC transporter ATP-binding protein [Candidatus Kapabacteria bacterium]|nr:ABC transporter ATP-binding protein [Candidatus Kapabacteria bacterium]